MKNLILVSTVLMASVSAQAAKLTCMVDSEAGKYNVLVIEGDSTKEVTIINRLIETEYPDQNPVRAKFSVVFRNQTNNIQYYDGKSGDSNIQLRLSETNGTIYAGLSVFNLMTNQESYMTSKCK